MLTSLLAFVVAGFAGGLAAQVLAVWTGATEEYVVVFVATVLIAIVVTFPFLVAQFFADSARAINRVAIGSLIIFAVALLGLAGWTLSVPAEQRAWESDMKIVAGLVLPGVAIILVQWLIVHCRAPNFQTPVRFGRRNA